jgi:hypothetical protein
MWFVLAFTLRCIAREVVAMSARIIGPLECGQLPTILPTIGVGQFVVDPSLTSWFA